jgi:hypothetical protein
LPTFIAVCLTILLTIFTFWSFFHFQPPTIAPTALVQTTALHQPANLDLSASQLTVITGSDYATTQQQIALGLQLQPQHFQLLLNAALIATQQGEVVTAQNYLDQAQAVSPNSPLFITP